MRLRHPGSRAGGSPVATRTPPTSGGARTHREGPLPDRLLDAYLGRTGVVVTLTLLAYVTFPPPGTLLAARMVAALGLLLAPFVGRDPRFWGLMLLLAAAGTLRMPLLDLDNHHFLQLYWLGALCLGNLATDPADAIRRIARLLVGLAFLYATLWKLLSPDFADGTFLTYLFSVMPAAEQAAFALGMQEQGLGAANRAALAAMHAASTAPPESVTVHVAPVIELIATPLSLLTVSIEGIVAMAFLLPVGRRWPWLRDTALLVFVCLTYLLVPVVTFGVLLAALGVAQSDLPERWTTTLYLAAALLIAAAS